MSNDTPPRACLADFGFMTMVLDSNKPMSCSAQLEGGTITFMSPELLLPSMFGIKNSIPNPEADIYAFGLVIFQVCWSHRGFILLAHTVQVITGEIPFRGVRGTELGFCVVEGFRPNQPANASAIGFSDSLWEFVQRCWGHNMNSRPKVSEVVTQLAKAAVSWRGVMPPCSQAEDTIHVSEALISESMQHCTFEISFIPLGIAYRMMMQVEFFIPQRLFRSVLLTPEPPKNHSTILFCHLQRSSRTTFGSFDMWA